MSDIYVKFVQMGMHLISTWPDQLRTLQIEKLKLLKLISPFDQSGLTWPSHDIWLVWFDQAVNF